MRGIGQASTGTFSTATARTSAPTTPTASPPPATLPPPCTRWVTAGCNLHEDTLARCRRILGVDHPYSLTLAGHLGADLMALGDHWRARAILQDTLSRCCLILGADHPETRDRVASVERVPEAEMTGSPISLRARTRPPGALVLPHRPLERRTTRAPAGRAPPFGPASSSRTRPHGADLGPAHRPTPPHPHRTHRQLQALAVAPDGSWLASTGFDGQVRIWDVQSARCTMSVRTRPYAQKCSDRRSTSGRRRGSGSVLPCCRRLLTRKPESALAAAGLKLPPKGRLGSSESD
jgi:hypothetical protein